MSCSVRMVYWHRRLCAVVCALRALSLSPLSELLPVAALRGNCGVVLSNRSCVLCPCVRVFLGRRPWSQEEDDLIVALVKEHGLRKCVCVCVCVCVRVCIDACHDKVYIRWVIVAGRLKGRSGKQCRERFKNQLDPTIRKDPWTPDEDRRICLAQRRFGNRWTEIAKLLPGRYVVCLTTHIHTRHTKTHKRAGEEETSKS